MPHNPLPVGWIAIVDDDDSIRRSLARACRVHDIDATTFESAEEFLSSVSAAEPRCMVLDVNLGGMSGFALQDRLVARGRTIPIIFMTAMNDIASTQLERRSGPNGYLRKPFDMKALMALVQRHLDTPAGNGNSASSRDSSARRSGT